MVSILPAQETDTPFILTSINEVNGKSGIKFKPYLNEQTLKQDVFSDNPAASIIIAAQESKSIGLIMYTPMYATALGRYLWAVQIFVHADYRGKGITKKMLNYLKENNPQANAICWAVTEDNKDAQPIFDKITDTKMNLIYYIKR